MINYKIVYSNRKTLGIYILKDGNVEIRCPKSVSKQTIDNFISEKQEWINRMSVRNRDMFEQKNEFTLSIGSKLMFLGVEYPLTAASDNSYGFDGNSFYVPSALTSEQIKQCIINLYKRLANDVIKTKIAEIAPQMHTMPSAVKINSAKTRWGSCSGKNSLNFSWKLIMADERAVDYVIVHELAHTFEHNHSSKFWNIVEKAMPDYRQRRSLLLDTQKKLALENWD